MRQFQITIEVATPGRGLVEITGKVRSFADGAGLETGLLTVFCRHTSASLLIQENADPNVRRDLEAYFERIAPEDPQLYLHDDEGPDDMPAHLRAALTQVSLSVPIVGGRLALGQWQGVFLFEHRSRPHRRQLVLHAMGD